VLGFIAKRLLWAVLLAWLMTVVTFLVFFWLPPNQPGSNRLGVVTANLQRQFNLEQQSMTQQYVHFLGHIVHGDLGESTRQPISVRKVIWDSLPVTVSLIIGGTVFWVLLAFPIGMLSALRPRSLLDKGLMTLVLIGVSAHPVWLSLIFSYFLGVRTHVFPVAGYCDFTYDPTSPNQCGGPRYWAYHMVLPWFTFALLFTALYARMIRASILEALGEDYVRTARAKGASSWRVMRKHVLRNALLPVTAMLSMDMVSLSLTGVIFIETVYQLPGLGQTLYRALTSTDLPVILGVVLVVSVVVVLTNMIADILYSLIDPRIRGGRRRRRLSADFRWPLRERPQVEESPT
jgi:peptide/nickel transport system permease protein